MNMQTNIKRTALNITTFCNLKCKHCLAFIPYYKDPRQLTFEQAKKVLNIYFQVVDTVEHFTVTGGEPLLNPEVKPILKETFKYLEQITQSVDFVTNGTLEIPDEILDLFEQNKDKTKIVLSNYGEQLSVKIESIEEKLIQRKINYRISKFYGDSLYYDGWIDFSDHSLKWKNKRDRDKNAQGCIHRSGKYFVINDGELHCCSRSFWRMKNGIIPKTIGEYVPLEDESFSIDEKRKFLLEMYSKTSSTSCAYCVGLRNDVPREYPAQQLTNFGKSSK